MNKITVAPQPVLVEKTHRIYSIDFLRGIVMMLMVLDHTRFFFYYGSFLNNPLNLETTTPLLFLTRWITHLCAPCFVLLAGTAAFLHGKKLNSKKALSHFLWTRGIWLVALEFMVITFGWFFDPNYTMFNVQVIFAIGMCMIVMAALIHLPIKAVIGLGLFITFTHNIYDGLQFDNYWLEALWIFFFKHGNTLLFNKIMYVYYPVIPWLGIMCLGYGLGTLYIKKDEQAANKRKRFL
ncbi:MAG: heparan-alpha-glucosaminide N-acetyltransferase domain-containing protein, partial [Bacteroidota bacterium]